MRALVLDDSGRPVLVDLPEPERPARVLATGLCGSDIEKLGTPGAALGHEVVVEAGRRRLALVHHRPCGACERCRAGHESTCDQFGAATIRPVGFAELVESTEGVELPAGVDDAVGTYVEPLACVLRGLERVPRGRVLVVGCGFVGRLFAAVLEHRGDEVFALEPRLERRCAPEPDGPVDAAVLCAGAGGDEATLALLRPGGTLVVFAPGGLVDLDTVYRRELAIVGSRSATPASMVEAARLLPDLDVPEPVVLPLERFHEGLELYRSGEALKVVFTP
ncbi:MAG TPA: alcohol dehydrogenase catalytic domain-containing protein [Gaiellaceae bacterium]